MKTRTVLFSAALACVATFAHAQQTLCQPDAFGGVTCIGPGGTMQLPPGAVDGGSGTNQNQLPHGTFQQDNMGGATRVQPDGYGGSTIYGPRGTTRVQPDGLGGSTISGPGGTTRVQPDGLGGSTISGPRGTTRVQPDGLGGSTIYGPNGTTRVQPDGLGGSTISGPGGARRCFTDQFGNTVCN